MWITIRKWLTKIVLVAVGVILAAAIVKTSINLLIDTSESWVYYPSWSGDVMYYDKNEVIELNKINNRDWSEMDSALLR